MNNNKYLYQRILLVCLLALTSCDLSNPEGNNIGKECEGGTPLTGHVYYRENDLISPRGVSGGGGGRSPDLRLGEHRIEFHRQWGWNDSLRTDGELVPNEWSNLEQKNNYYSLSLELENTRTGRTLFDFGIETGGEWESNGQQVCQNSEGALFIRSSKER